MKKEAIGIWILMITICIMSFLVGNAYHIINENKDCSKECNDYVALRDIAIEKYCGCSLNDFVPDPEQYYIPPMNLTIE